MKKIISIALILMMCFSIINASAISVTIPEKVSYAILNFDRSEIPFSFETVFLNFYVSTQHGLSGNVYAGSQIDLAQTNYNDMDLTKLELISFFTADSNTGKVTIDVSDYVKKAKLVANIQRKKLEMQKKQKEGK